MLKLHKETAIAMLDLEEKVFFFEYKVQRKTGAERGMNYAADRVKGVQKR